MSKKKMSNKAQSNNYKSSLSAVFIIGDKCIAVKLGWGGDGSPQRPLHRIDVKGIISSIIGFEGHNNIHKYEFTWERGRFYTDNLENELIPLLPVERNHPNYYINEK